MTTSAAAAAAAAAARRGVRLLTQQYQQQATALAVPAIAAAAIVARPPHPHHRPLHTSRPPLAAEQQQTAPAKQQPKQQQQQPQLSPQRVAAYDFARQTFGAVLDRYNPSARLPLTPLAPFSPQGRAALKQRFTDLVNRGVVVSHLNRRVPGFSLAELKGGVAALYEQVNSALASGQRGLAAAEDSVASGELQRLRGDAHARALAGWERVEWKLAEPIDTRKIKIVHARYAQVAPTSMTGFVQVTFKIPSKQVFAAYRRASGGAVAGGRKAAGAAGGAAGAGAGTSGASPTPNSNSTSSEWELAAGDPSTALDVVDYWVLERKTAADDRLNKEAAAATGGGGAGGGAAGQRAASDPPGARWRLVARLSLHNSQERQGQGGR
jgi:hypothetical protein